MELFCPDNGAEIEDTKAREYILAGRSEGDYDQVLHNVSNQLLDGQGECMCTVGVDSRGRLIGLNDKEYAASLETVRQVAADLNAVATVVVEKVVKGAAKAQCAEVLVRRTAEHGPINLRIATCGNVDSGKSTFVGVLTKGVLDNGRGSVRQKVFRHKHEMDTGRTSDVAEHVMGFDPGGHVVNYEALATPDAGAQRHAPSAKQICDQSAKMLTFYDLAGHEKYLKTTVLGMTGAMPDYACIVVSANNGVQRMTKEHLGLCLALAIPFFVVVTRVDMTPEPVTKHTTETIAKLLKHPDVRKLPFPVRRAEDAVVCAKNVKDGRIAPVFHVSSVTGAGLGLLQRFLNLLPVAITDTFSVLGVGTVVSGIVRSGSVRPNDTVWLGPNGNGQFRPAVVKSLHVQRTLMDRVEAGESACFALKRERRADLRKGMVLVDAKLKRPEAVWEFEAEVEVKYHSTTIHSNYQPVVHCGTVRQACAITLVDREVLRTGDKARVKFRFVCRPEYVTPGARLVFCEGRTKGIGTITATCGPCDSQTCA